MLMCWMGFVKNVEVNVVNVNRFFYKRNVLNVLKIITYATIKNARNSV